jgi:cytochrome c oxidase subunit 4
MTTSEHDEQQHAVPCPVYFNVWIGLLILTGLTVGASYIDFGHVGLLTAILIATVKGSLVLLYFMHIRFERPLFVGLILAVLVTYGIFIGLTFSDYWYR